MLNKLLEALQQYQPEVQEASSGSVYISFTGSKVRIANHTGHKLKRNVWELRSDAMTSRKNPANRIYNVRDVAALIRDFK